MKLFIDSANVEEIQKAASTGLVDGVTTNPSLVAKSGQEFKQGLKRICDVISGPVSAEVTALDAPGMIEQGRSLAQIASNIVVKVPLTIEGLKATQAFSKDGIQTNVTLCFSTNQAYLAAKSGATYVSPFIGRLDDIGQEGMDLIGDIRAVYDQYGYSTQILAASIRHSEHVLQSLRYGADVATMPYAVFEKLIHHPLTSSGLDRFLDDWKKSGLSL